MQEHYVELSDFEAFSSEKFDYWRNVFLSERGRFTVVFTSKNFYLESLGDFCAILLWY